MDPRIVVEIGRYVLAHPHGADTLEGVVSWWLPADLAQSASPGEVERALQELVGRGLIEQRPLPSGQVFYAVAPAKGSTP